MPDPYPNVPLLFQTLMKGAVATNFDDGVVTVILPRGCEFHASAANNSPGRPKSVIFVTEDTWERTRS